MNWNRRVTTCLCMFCIFAPPILAGETTSSESGSKPIPKELAGLRERWTSAFDEFCVPGLAIVVVKDDKVIYLDTFGYRNIEKKLSVTPDTQFYIASATKPFTATGIMTLVDQGKIKLDDPVKKYLPRMELPDAELTGKITIRDLMCHAYGINCGPIVFLDAYTGEITDDRYYHLLKQYGEVKGSTDYTNVHFTLLGRVIESVTGMSWRDYLDEAIFRPAGMTRTTGYADRMYHGDDYATPYEVGADGLEPARHRKMDSTMHAAGGLGLSINDAARWLRLWMNSGEIDGKHILNSASAAEMLRLHSNSPNGRIRAIKGFGLAWAVGTFQPDGPTYASHGGGYIGAGAHFSFLPEKKIGVVVLTNAGAPAAIFADNIISVDIYDKLLNANLPDLLPGLRVELTKRLPGLRALAAKFDAEEKSADVTKLALPRKAYCGSYENEWFGRLTIKATKQGLRFRLGKMTIPAIKLEGDAVTLLMGEESRAGKFEVDAKRANAVTLNLEAGSIRFVRK